MGKLWWVLAVIAVILIIYLTGRNKKKEIQEENVPKINGQNTDTQISDKQAEENMIERENTRVPVLTLDPPQVPADQSKTTEEYIEWLKTEETFQAPSAPDLAEMYFHPEEDNSTHD